MRITVVIIEDDRNYNNALKKIIDFDSDLLCLAQCLSGREALMLLPDTMPDVALMDIQLQDSTGIELVEKLKRQLPYTQFIMCTSFEDDEYIYEALRVGASGYLIKGESMEKIISSIKDVHSGGAPMSSSVAKKVIQHFRQPTRINEHLNALTESEKDILELLSHGLLYKEIAGKKYISIDTVKKHVGNIYRKLQVSNKVEAINVFNNKN
ncbi:MAG: response regulator [Niabella sp.]